MLLKGIGMSLRVEIQFDTLKVIGGCIIIVLGNRTTYTYDQFGNLATVINPLGNAIVYEYDLRGRKTYEGGATYPVRYTYDIFGNKTTMMTYRREGRGNGEEESVDFSCAYDLIWYRNEINGTIKSVESALLEKLAQMVREAKSNG